MLTAEERQMIRKYRRLDIRGKNNVDAVLETSFKWIIKGIKDNQPRLRIIEGGKF